MSGAKRRSGGVGLGLIVAYKFVKASIELSVALAMLHFGTAIVAQRLSEVLEILRHHAAEAWSLALADQLVTISTGRNLLVVALALLLDGIFSLFEAWVLHRRYAWGRWLVVIATATLLPVECVALARHVSVGRIVILFANAGIVVYLSRQRGFGSAAAL